MLSTVWAVVRDGMIELLEPADLPEGSRVLVTLLEDMESASWWQDGEVSLGPAESEAEEDAENPVAGP